MIQNVEDLTEACRILIDKANERGGEDNITVVIARFDGEALHSATESGSITGSFRDRKSTRLNSSHLVISYAVFCLKKKKNPIYSAPYEAAPEDTLLPDAAIPLSIPRRAYLAVFSTTPAPAHLAVPTAASACVRQVR